MRRSKWYIGLLLLWTTAAFSQDITADLERMEQQYSSVDDIYMEVENSVSSKGKVNRSESGQIYKQGGKYYYKFDQMAMLVNKKYVIIVDYGGYNIIVNDWTRKQAKALKNQYIPTGKDLLEKYPTVEYMLSLIHISEPTRR